MCAALSAREAGARVLVVEKAPEAWRGGNGFFTAGGFRFAFKSFEELCDLVGDLSDEEKASMEVDPYTEETFYDDPMRVTEDCADPDLAMLLVRQSQPTVRWMRDRGVRWIPMFGRQAYKVDGRFRFWGGLVLEAVGGGPGLIDMEYQAAAKAGIDVRFETKAIRLLTDDRGAVTGIAVRTPAGAETIPARAVVLAAGGFEANPEIRMRYLGRNWDLARVRGTPYNTGDDIRMALEGLARKLEIDVEGFLRTVAAFNAAVEPGAFNAAIKDGKRTRGIAPPKSNWALPLDAPPFVGYAVTTGITFTFGGLRITDVAQVVDTEQRPIPGLFAAGELVGGLFYHNYPGGAGLMAGAVFGRIAGRSAAAHCRSL